VTQIKFDGNPCRKCGSTTRYIGSGRCVACLCAGHHRRYAAHPEAHREARREAQRRRRAANPEKERAATNARRAAANARYAANPEKARETKRARYAANPEKKTLEKNRARRALEKGAASDGTHRLWDERLKEHDGTCVHCGERAGKLTLDHFIPLTKGGAHVLLNFVPSCKSCNSAKGATVIAMTARIQAFLNGSLATCTRNQGGGA
jgi:5-methylcytosine-specific restriction endonuclease McrA